jgi:hypothetical protein
MGLRSPYQTYLRPTLKLVLTATPATPWGFHHKHRDCGIQVQPAMEELNGE